MPYYESVFIARQEISAQQAEALAENFAGVISEGGGNVTRTESWGLKSLAYRIKKNRKAHYTMMNIDGPAEAVHEMERQMRLHEDVLRYMTIRVDELDDEPSIQAQSGSSREDRDDDDQGYKARSKSEESSTSEKSSDEAEDKNEAADEEKETEE
jgi:small subunit ribosomal protein S6